MIESRESCYEFAARSSTEPEERACVFVCVCVHSSVKFKAEHTGAQTAGKCDNDWTRRDATRTRFRANYPRLISQSVDRRCYQCSVRFFAFLFTISRSYDQVSLFRDRVFSVFGTRPFQLWRVSPDQRILEFTRVDLETKPNVRRWIRVRSSAIFLFAFSWD